MCVLSVSEFMLHCIQLQLCAAAKILVTFFVPLLWCCNFLAFSPGLPPRASTFQKPRLGPQISTPRFHSKFFFKNRLRLFLITSCRSLRKAFWGGGVGAMGYGLEQNRTTTATTTKHPYPRRADQALSFTTSMILLTTEGSARVLTSPSLEIS